MATLRRPSLMDRTLSTPPLTPDSVPALTLSSINKQYPGLAFSTLSPPTSPNRSRSSSNLSDLSLNSSERKLIDIPQPKSLEPAIQAESSEARECPFAIEILKDPHGRDQVFGKGVWSTVYRATTHNKPSTSYGIATPPQSPTSSPPVLVAVKKPVGKQAFKIIESEGKVLTHISEISENELYVVPFFGMADSAIVMAPVPLSLEQHINKCANLAEEILLPSNSCNPVLGSTEIWLDLAHHLVSALDWLQNDAGVVHGDIKPGNILLSPRPIAGTGFEYRPLFADFSSAQILDAEPTPNTLSAVTREYTAPELLSVAVLKDPKSTATPASDVFSLAVTLLAAATGDTMVYQGSMFHRQAMATQGWNVLSHVRNFANVSRVPRYGTVENILERAVLKAGMGRIDAQTWRELIEEKQKGAPVKKR